MPHTTREDFYNDPDLYDKILFEDSTNEVEYYAQKCKDKDKILYFGCGTGRILNTLTKVCDNVVGVELAPNMAKKAQENSPKAKILNADVLKLDIDKDFDLIIAPYEFLNHFKSSEVSKVLEVTHKHLVSGGTFVTDMKNPFTCANAKNKAELAFVELRPDNVFEKGYTTYDHENQMYFDFIELLDMTNNTQKLITMSWYYYFSKQIEELLNQNGFKVNGVFGDFVESKFNEDSDVMLFESVKQ